jgi:hypothetical protein
MKLLQLYLWLEVFLGRFNSKKIKYNTNKNEANASESFLNQNWLACSFYKGLRL